MSAAGTIRFLWRVTPIPSNTTKHTPGLLQFEPRVVATEPLDADAAGAIVDGLLAVPVTGTAAQAFSGFDHERFPLAAKTGTAEVNDKADNALFAGFGPWPNPEYAFAIIIEEGGFGGVAAAPVARAFFDAVLISDEAKA